MYKKKQYIHTTLEHTSWYCLQSYSRVGSLIPGPVNIPGFQTWYPENTGLDSIESADLLDIIVIFIVVVSAGGKLSEFRLTREEMAANG